MTRYFMTALLGILLAGCATPPSVEFYVLEPSSQTAPVTLASVKQHSIGIGPITIPAVLEHKGIITRHPGNAVQIAQFQQWASPLPDNLLQALTRNLSSLQPNNIVRAYPWSVHGMVDLQIIVDVIRFDTTLGESANLEANWTIKNEKTNAILKNGRSVINHSLSDSSYPGTVRALSRILGEFGQELSLALLKVEINQ
jgi:uncharacterized protein